jgi:hypothetical protein
MTSLNAAKVYGFDLTKLQAIADKIGPTVKEIATPVRRDELPRAALGFTVAEAIAMQAAAAE